MTVIAWDNTHIAWDGRLTAANTIYAHDVQKVKFVKETIYGFCGDFGLWDDLIHWHKLGARRDRVPKFGAETEWQLLAITRKEIAVFDNSMVSKTILRTPYALGSGSDFARGALLAGKSAYRAVKIACLCDMACGGEVGTLAFADVFGGKFDGKKLNPTNRSIRARGTLGQEAQAS